MEANYKTTFPIVEQHIIEVHPEYCYKCRKCGKLYVNTKSLKNCKCCF